MESQQQSAGTENHASLRPRVRYGKLGYISSKREWIIWQFHQFYLMCKLFPSPSQYCRSIREQILSSFTHRNFSIMVVGNKFDLVVDSPNSTQVSDISSIFFSSNNYYFFLSLIQGTQGYFFARSQALEIGLRGVFCKVSESFSSSSVSNIRTFEKVY